MTDTTDIGGNVVPLKPAPKPKAQPKKADPFALEGTPFAGGHNPGAAIEAFEVETGNWSRWNQARTEDGVLGIDGIILEHAFTAAATGNKADLLKLAELAKYAAECGA